MRLLIDTLKMVDCDENLLHQKVYSLSGGEQQRIAFVKILLKNPEVILADEPTASLDEENKKVIINHIKQFVKSGKMAIIVSHDPWVISQGDEILEIDNLTLKRRTNVKIKR